MMEVPAPIDSTDAVPDSKELPLRITDPVPAVVIQFVLIADTLHRVEVTIIDPVPVVLNGKNMVDANIPIPEAETVEGVKEFPEFARLEL